MRATSTGSPASRSPTKLTPLTTRPALTSRHGMMRFASMETEFNRDFRTAQATKEPPATRATTLDRVFWRRYFADSNGAVFPIFMADPRLIRHRRLWHADRRGR